MVAALAGVCVASYYVFKAVEVASGKETNFNALIRGAAELNLSQYAAAVIIALFGGTAYYNYKGRKKAEVAAARAAKLERLLDPGRSSSGLLEGGDNPKGDPK